MLGDLLLAAVLASLGGFFARKLCHRWTLHLWPFWLVLAVLIVIGLVTRAPQSPLFLGPDDGEYYLSWAGNILEDWQSGDRWWVGIWPGKGVWPLGIAVGTFFFGEILISLILLNSLLVSFSVVLLQRATAISFGQPTGRWMVALLLSSPPILLFGPSLLRESTWWFGVSAGILSASYVHATSYRKGLMFFLVGSVTLLAIRPDFGVIVVFLVGAANIVVWAVPKRRFSKKRAFAAGAALLLMAGFFPITFETLANVEDVPERVKTVTVALANWENPETALSTDIIDPDNSGGQAEPRSIADETVERLPSIFFGPFPSELGPQPVWFVLLAATWHFLFLIGANIALLSTKYRRRVPTLVFTGLAVAVMLVLSVVLTNYGIVMRHRMTAELFLLPGAAHFCSTWLRNR